MKPFATVALWAALAVQSLWSLRHGADAFGLAVLVVLGALAALGGRHPWTAVPVRLLLGADFLLSVGSRFGVFGGPGQPGVAWGDFAHFTAYTRELVPFLPGWTGTPVAVAATVAETGLGVALLLGVAVRRAAFGAAGLLLVFGVCMALSQPAAEQFRYCVFVLAAGVLRLACAERQPLSLGARLAASR